MRSRNTLKWEVRGSEGEKLGMVLLERAPLGGMLGGTTTAASPIYVACMNVHALHACTSARVREHTYVLTHVHTHTHSRAHTHTHTHTHTGPAASCCHQTGRRSPLSQQELA